MREDCSQVDQDGYRRLNPTDFLCQTILHSAGCVFGSDYFAPDRDKGVQRPRPRPRPIPPQPPQPPRP